MSESDRDFEIQERLDAGDVMDPDLDVVAFQRLYTMLGARGEPLSLPDTFAGSVMARILALRLESRAPTATLTSMMASVLALAASTCALLGLSAMGYGNVDTWAALARIVAGIPESAGYIALSLLMLAISDIVINHRLTAGIMPKSQ
jgi:hypothetical protein